MKYNSKQLLIFVLMVMLPIQTALAYMFGFDGREPTSGESSALSVISPLILSMYIKDEMKESTSETKRYRRAERERHEARQRKLQTAMPDMLVKEIYYDESNGLWQMKLEDPNNPENYAILEKHFQPDHRPDNDTHSIVNLQEGDKVVFGEGSLGGWLLYDETGKKIGYAVPDDVQLESYSDPF